VSFQTQRVPFRRELNFSDNLNVYKLSPNQLNIYKQFFEKNFSNRTDFFCNMKYILKEDKCFKSWNVYESKRDSSKWI
jgi:hypothetical protein